MEKNNIFKYAPKEFTHDAAIAWLVKCYKSEETKEIGEKFIKEFILELDKDEKIKAIRTVEPQYHKIDVLIEIETNKQLYSIICENKKGTFLHDKQLKKYVGLLVNQNRKEKTKIIVILFKSENIFPYEEIQYKKEEEEIREKFQWVDMEFKTKNASDFIKGLKRDTNNTILNMLIEYYEQIIKENNMLKEKDWKLQMSSEEWKEFYERVIDELEKLEMKSGEIFRPIGPGIQSLRTDFAVKENSNFSKKANKIIPNSTWAIGIDWGIKGVAYVPIIEEYIWENETRVILWCNTDGTKEANSKRNELQQIVKNKLKGVTEIEVKGKTNMFAKIEIDEEELLRNEKKEIAEVIIEKATKLYNEVLKCINNEVAE